MTTTNGAWTNLPTSYSYAWQDCDTAGNNCTAISGATSSSYTLSAEDVSHTVRSVVTASNLVGYGTASSDATASVLPLPPANTTAPTVSGATQQGQTLSTTNGSWSNGPTSFEYAWQDCDTAGNNCTNISGATATTYTLAAGDVGHTIEAVVTATNAGGSTSAASAATAVVATLAPPPPPSNTALPVVTGTTTQGQTLSTSNGSWTGSPTSYSYRWRQCDSAGNNCTDISGATATTYSLAAGDVGHTIKSVVSATNAGGSGSATSAQTAAVTSNIPAPPANSTLPAISGTVAQGQALTTSNGSWTNNPSSFAYKWEDCNSSGASCTIISGATSNTYILTTADVGDTIRAIVTATNPGGSGSATSAQTAAVTSSPSSNTDCAGANGSGVVNQSSLDACGFPSMNTTGPAAGTTFTSSSGFSANTAGQVYNGLNVNGEISINASNVTIQNSNITAVDPNQAAIKVASGVTGVKIVNDSIHGTNAVQSGSLAFAVSYYGGSISGGDDRPHELLQRRPYPDGLRDRHELILSRRRELHQRR